MMKIKQCGCPPLILIFTVVLFIIPIFFTNEVLAISVFINELHYDNTGADTGEAIEVAGPAGTDLSGWDLVLYNGASLESYGSKALSGIISDQQAGFGTLSFSFGTIQNGAPDGLALVDMTNTVVQFLSYEGTFTAINSPANGMTSIDIGVSESSSTPVGYSLQLAGIGTTYEDFFWEIPGPASFGGVNSNQTFVAPTPVPEPNMFLLLASGLACLIICRKFNRIAQRASR